MQWLSWLLFESVAALGGVLGLVWFALLVAWRRGGSARPFAISVAAGIALLVVQALVTTRGEQAAATLTRIERDIVAGRTAALAAALDSQFSAGGMNAKAFVDYAGVQLEIVRVHWVRRTRLEIESQGPDRFVAIVGYQCGASVREMSDFMIPSRWRMTFSRGAGGWRIVTIDPPEIASTQFPNWDIRP